MDKKNMGESTTMPIRVRKDQIEKLYVIKHEMKMKSISDVIESLLESDSLAQKQEYNEKVIRGQAKLLEYANLKLKAFDMILQVFRGFHISEEDFEPEQLLENEEIHKLLSRYNIHLEAPKIISGEMRREIKQ